MDPWVVNAVTPQPGGAGAKRMIPPHPSELPVCPSHRARNREQERKNLENWMYQMISLLNAKRRLKTMRRKWQLLGKSWLMAAQQTRLPPTRPTGSGDRKGTMRIRTIHRHHSPVSTSKPTHSPALAALTLCHYIKANICIQDSPKLQKWKRQAIKRHQWYALNTLRPLNYFCKGNKTPWTQTRAPWGRLAVGAGSMGLWRSSCGVASLAHLISHPAQRTPQSSPW